ncbi:hypothetical protein KR067_008137 [Drosophila pandora]|nr:hypothetical protein KR067_008137 [Drosophila pandora]
MERILIICILVACGLVSAMAQECQVCQAANDVYCHNKTSYQYCMSGDVVGGVETCPEGTVCSNSDNVCVATADLSATILDVCGGTNCGGCNINAGKYACVSRTQYARCTSQNEIGTVFSCPEDEICIFGALAAYKNICVPACAADFVNMKSTCSNTDYATTTTTAAPTTTPSTTDLQSACSTAASTTSSSYFYTRYTTDTTCGSYIYCEPVSGSPDTWQTVFFVCPFGKPFYDSATSRCVATKPSNC